MIIDDCKFPGDRLYDVDDHVWVKANPDETIVGIDSVLTWLSGGFTSVAFKRIGSTVHRGDSLGSAQGLRHFDVVRAPVSCTLLEVNSGLLRNPRLLNKDPYESGWFAKIRPLPGEDLSKLRGPGDAEGELRQKLMDLHVHCFAEYPDQELFEVGVECSAVLVILNELLSKSERETIVHVVSDDPTAEIEMKRWSDQTSNEVIQTKKEGALFHFIVRKSD